MDSSSPPLMHSTLPDLRIPPPRLSPGVLAIVVLIHAGILSVILMMPRAMKPVTPPAPLYVRLIESVAEQVVPAPASSQAPLAQPAPRAPVMAAARPVPQPESEPVKEVRRQEPAELLRPESSRSEPQLAPAPAPVPAPVAVESPKPASPPPLPVTQPRFNADYLDNPKPPYPNLSRRMGEEGEVRLRVHVDTSGNAQQVEIARSSGFPRLDQAALDTVKQWRFVPARQGDQPIPAWVIVPIQFSLRS